MPIELKFIFNKTNLQTNGTRSAKQQYEQDYYRSDS